MIELDKGILRPDLLAKLLARDQFSRMLQQHGEHLEGLFLKVNPDSVLAQFPGMQIRLEQSKANHSTRARVHDENHSRYMDG